jgi:hypothetical protein
MIETMMNRIPTYLIDLDTVEFAFLYTGSIVLMLGSIPFGFYFIRHGRIMQDTPTAKIRSVSQGFVELQGKARSIDDKPLRSPGKQQNCVWYDYKVEERRRSGNRHNWETIVKDRSPYSFYVDDGSGVCAIDPDEAKVKPKTTAVWTHGQHRFTESRIDENEDIYCLGQFETEQGPSRNEVIKEGARAYLNGLKQNRQELLRQFDADGDGEIDMDEWNKAREAAKAKVRKEVDDDYEPTQHHVLVKPFNKKHPFIVSCYHQDELTLRYRFYSIGSFIAFFISGTLAITMTVITLSN